MLTASVICRSIASSLKTPVIFILKFACLNIADLTSLVSADCRFSIPREYALLDISLTYLHLHSCILFRKSRRLLCSPPFLHFCIACIFLSAYPLFERVRLMQLSLEGGSSLLYNFDLKIGIFNPLLILVFQGGIRGCRNKNYGIVSTFLVPVFTFLLFLL